jgi:hypothetical protein
VGKFIHLIERTVLVSRVMCVTVCVIVSGIGRGKIFTFYRKNGVR